MTTAHRRVVLYWLLLLGPSLAVGGSALWLLNREQSRVVAQAEAADSARREAVTERVRLITENIEILVSDVQSTLARTLAETPDGQARSYLEGLRQTNPLVADAFEADVRGVLQWGGVKIETAEWVGAKGWDPRPAAMVGEQDDYVENRKEIETEKMAKDAMRRQVASNVSNYNSVRSSTQEVASRKVSAAVMSDFAIAPAASAARSEAEGIGRRRDSLSPASVTWTPWLRDERLDVFGWLRTGDGEVRGIVLDLEALRRQLGAVLPVESATDETYELVTRDPVRGDDPSLYSKARGLSNAVVRVPLSATMLPGWQVVGVWSGGSSGGLGGGAFFTLTSVLVGLFVVAIIVGGGLLLREARRSEIEAQQKTSFVANISHELKTPLTTIRMYAELLEQGRVATEEKQHTYLGVIGRESARLSRLIGNALDFSRLEEGRKTYQMQELDLVQELERFLVTQEPRVGAAGMRLVRKWTQEELLIKTDPDALQQILLNLIDNACKYAGEGEEIEVAVQRATESGGAVEVVVSDRGPGIATSSREKVFEKFHRVDDRLTAEQGGAGLGLGIARQLARGLGGDLRCESRAGGGISFILKLS